MEISGCYHISIIMKKVNFEVYMGNATDLKKRNVLDILRIIHFAKLCSKSEIAQQLELSPVTVHNIISELCRAGFCEEGGEQTSNGGRNAVLYRIKRDCGYIIGLALSSDYINLTVYNFGLEKKYEEKTPCRMEDVDRCIEQMKNMISLGAEKAGGEIMGIGVTIPGRSDKNGVIGIMVGYPMWRGVPLRAMLSDTLGENVPVYIENGNNALALSIKWKDRADSAKNYVYLTADDGVGSGVMINNALFYGGHSNGCEIGHLQVDPDGLPCRCGRKGCLQAYASDDALKKRLAKFDEPSIKGALEKASSDQNGPVYAAFDKTASYIALAVESMLKIFDPEIIFIQSSWLGSLPELLYKIRDIVYTNCPWVSRSELRILLCYDEELIACAPACVCVEKLYKVSENSPFYRKLSEL